MNPWEAIGITFGCFGFAAGIVALILHIDTQRAKFRLAQLELELLQADLEYYNL